MKGTAGRLGRFVTVGTLGTAVDFGLFTMLHAVLGLPTLPANTLSYCAGIVNNYVWHRCWTYGGCPHQAMGLQFTRFLAVSLCALAVNNAVVLLLTAPLGVLVASPTLGALLAKVGAMAVGLALNYVANTYWTFRNAR